MDLISVIVPVYNVEKYLDRCVQSIVNQTYKNLEIILVDDGSPDNCGKMCDDWAHKDSRVKVVHKTNGGLSDARNAGMAVAQGEYIAFVDSDDWVDIRFVELLYNAASVHKVKLSACDAKTVYRFESENIPDLPQTEVFTSQQALQTLTVGQKFRAVAWNKLYHRTLLEDEQFEVDRYHEDEFFTYRILAKNNYSVYVNAPLYYYFQREGSIMNSASFRHLDALDAYIERINFFRQHYPELYKKDKAMFCIACVNLYSDGLRLKGDEKKRYADRIKDCRKQVEFKISELTNYSFKELIYILSSRFCLNSIGKILSKRKD